jgi:FkbM family methyltransferase
MKFISYSQNYEDVLLMRCFGSIKDGFYIDVGAQDPNNDSVTKAFYDLGWSGINIEPVPSAFNSIQVERLRDINLNLAISDKEDQLEIWEFPGTGLSTAVKDFAKLHIERGMKFNRTSVKAKTLQMVCNEYSVKTVHFLKIDVEGFETKVLQGLNLSLIRPQIILVESTIPNSPTENFIEWEYLLLEQGYLFCYKDGLNRFYAASEFSHLKRHFEFPPNVFDDFVKADVIKLEKRIDDMIEGHRLEMEQCLDRIRLLKKGHIFDSSLLSKTIKKIHSSLQRNIGN